jgi:hypothetical protein
MACDLPDVKVQFQLNAEQLETVTEALVEAEYIRVQETDHLLVWVPRDDAPPRFVRSITIRNV